MSSWAGGGIPVEGESASGGHVAIVGDKTSATAWYGLAVLIATTLFAFVDRQIINLIAPTLQKDLGLSDFELGAMQGLGLALFASVAGYPIGWLSDRFGRRLILGICVVVWSASTAACAFQHSFAGIFAATGGIAIGEAALAPIIFSMLPDLFPERQRNTANFIFFAAVMLGAAAGIGLGGATLGWLATHQQMLPGFLAGMDSWRVALIFVAAPAPLFVLLLTTVRLGGSARRAGATTNEGRPKKVDRLLPFLRAHWRTLVCIYGTISAYGLTLSSSFTWLPVVMPRIFPGTQPSAVGMQLGITTAIGTVVGLLLPAVAGRFMRGDATLKPLSMVRFFLIAAILPTLSLLFASAPWQIYAASAVQMALVLATAALMPGVMQQSAPPGLRSRLLSILGIVGAVTGGLSPLLVGALSGVLEGPRGILNAIVIVSMPGWAIGALLITMARRPFLTTVAAVGRSAG